MRISTASTMPPKKPASAADEQPRRRHGDSDHRDDRQRDAAAIEEPRQDIAPELVGAEPVLRARRREPQREVRQIGIIGRQRRSGEREDCKRQHDREPRERRRMGGKRPRAVAPPLKPRRRSRLRCRRVAGDVGAGEAHRVLGSSQG